MPTFDEMNKKVEVSIGLIVAIIAATFMVTSFYITQNTLESRMDKRYNRLDERLEQVEKYINNERERCR